VNKSIKLVKMGKIKEAEKAIRPAVNYLMKIKCKKNNSWMY
jgi:aspartate racemase